MKRYIPMDQAKREELEKSLCTRIAAWVTEHRSETAVCCRPRIGLFAAGGILRDGAWQVYGLDQPIHIRYLKWLGRTVQGDLGFSRTYKEPVTELMRDRIGNSLWLTVTAFVLAPARMAAF